MPVEILSPFTALPWEPDWISDFLTLWLFFGFSQQESLARDLKTGGEYDLGIHSSSSLILSWVFLAGTWIGHSFCLCGSFGDPITPPPPLVPSGPAVVTASFLDVFSGPFSVLRKLSLNFSRIPQFSLPSLCCYNSE